MVLRAATGLVVLVLWSAVMPASAETGPDRAAVALTAPLGSMAEAAVAADPANPRHLVAAADPYQGVPNIRLVSSNDGGMTWSTPTVVLPPGFAKSFDPVISVGTSGIIVVGGASGTGQAGCQPASAVFMATITAGEVSYVLIRDARRDGSYVDRPGLTLSPTENRAYVTWTESTGPSAECRGTPIRSKVMIATGQPPGQFDPPVTLPTSGLPAPFGATPAVSADGTLLVAIGEHAGAHSRVTVTASPDQARTFSAPETVFDGTSPANTVTGVSGFVAAVPSVTLGPAGRTAVAFVNAQPGNGAAAVVVERTAGQPWRTISPPVKKETVEVLPQVAYDRIGNLWLLSARATSGYIDMALRRRGPDWEGPITLARGRSDRYIEVGEALGLLVTDNAVITAAPINRTTDSALVVAVHQIPQPETPATTVATPLATGVSTTVPPSDPPGRTVPLQPQKTRPNGSLRIAAIGAAVASLAATIGIRRRRQNTRSRRLST